MRGTILPLPQYAFMTWCSVKAQGEIYLYFYGRYEEQKLKHTNINILEGI
jgi:hypothetical protein